MNLEAKGYVWCGKAVGNWRKPGRYWVQFRGQDDDFYPLRWDGAFWRDGYGDMERMADADAIAVILPAMIERELTEREIRCGVYVRVARAEQAAQAA
jgi:hypothetical protein